MVRSVTSSNMLCSKKRTGTRHVNRKCSTKGRGGQAWSGRLESRQGRSHCRVAGCREREECVGPFQRGEGGVGLEAEVQGGTLFSAKRFELALEKYKKINDAVSNSDQFDEGLKAKAVEVKKLAELNRLQASSRSVTHGRSGCLRQSIEG